MGWTGSTQQSLTCVKWILPFHLGSLAFLIFSYISSLFLIFFLIFQSILIDFYTHLTIRKDPLYQKSRGLQEFRQPSRNSASHPGIPPAIQEFPHSGKYPLELPITYDKHTSHSQDLTLIYSSFNHSIYHRQLSSLPIRITTISYNTYIMLFLIFV